MRYYSHEYSSPFSGIIFMLLFFLYLKVFCMTGLLCILFFLRNGRDITEKENTYNPGSNYLIFSKETLMNQNR